MPVLALLAACGAGFLWGTGALVVNLLVAQHGFTPENISFWRFAIGSVVLLGIFGKNIHWRLVQPVLGRLTIAGIAMAGYVLCWFLGIERMGAAVPTLIALCLPPVLVTMVAVVRGQEIIDRQLFSVLVAAIIGTILIVFQHGEANTAAGFKNVVIGIAFSLVSAFLYAGFSMTSGRLSKVLGAGQSTTCLTVIATLVMAIFGLFRPLSWPVAVPPQAWFLYLGVVTAALALLAFSWGAAKLSPTTLTVATLLEPLTAVVLSAFILGAQMSHLQLLGGGLLMLSIWVLGKRASPVDS
ncbi:DMT family transporter [Agarivorans sp. QJM3NY_29]|uniref:DMT family transporter n=1 Tax=unclassified Agarivorans TaxID=2636026 RepID=UPI003D7E4384